MKSEFKHYFLVLLFSITFLTSCDKLFKEEPQNIFHLNTKQDYEVAMAGLYNRVFNGVIGNKTVLLYAIGNGDDINVIPSIYLGYIDDDINKENNCVLCEYNLGASINCDSNPCGSDGGCSSQEDRNLPIIYELLFQAIGSANDILSKAGDLNKLNPNFKKIIGEVYYLRAYCYFRLVRLYGQVPIIDDPDVDFTLPKPSFKQLYEFITNDLLKSIELLPKNNAEARIAYETPHQGTAKALLAEVYLTMGGRPVYDESKYSAAARIAGEVIDNADYYGFGLMPDLADLWNGQSKKNMETEFSIYLIDSTKDNSKGLDNMNSDLFALTDINDKFRFLYILLNEYYTCKAAPAFYNDFPKSYRKEVSFQTRHRVSIYSYDWDSILKRVVPKKRLGTYLKHYDSINICTNIPFKKFYSRLQIPDSVLLNNLPGINHDLDYGFYTGGTVYLFRYAQTLLTYAEAKARSGVVDASAYEAINKVRRRAAKMDLNSPSAWDLSPGLSPQAFADSVVQERAWELCAEPEGRWFDMLRLDIVKDIVAIKQHQGLIVYPIPIDRKTYFLPIPELDKTLNPNLE